MIIEVKNIVKEFQAQRGLLRRARKSLRALDNISFSVEEKGSLGIVGESGSGKTTLAKILLKLIPQTSGEIVFDDSVISCFRKDVQIVFQNPFNSLNPKMRVRDILSEPLLIHRIAARKQLKERVMLLLERVGLDASALLRYPREFSGGQRQRICIARALAPEPKVLVLDEPISSLDLTVQSEMLDLFAKIKEQYRLTYLFISHNLAIIRHSADSIIVMERGKIVEEGRVEKVFSHPQHPYTRMLMAAARG